MFEESFQKLLIRVLDFFQKLEMSFPPFWHGFGVYSHFHEIHEKIGMNLWIVLVFELQKKLMKQKRKHKKW